MHKVPFILDLFFKLQFSSRMRWNSDPEDAECYSNIPSDCDPKDDIVFFNNEGAKTLLITESFAILLCQARWDKFTDVNLELHKSNIMGCMEGFGMGANIAVYGPPSHALTRRLNGRRAKCVALPLPPSPPS